MAHWGGFTFKWYQRLLHNESIMSALYYTLVVAILSSLIATVIGTISAIGISKMKSKSRKLMLNINYLPCLLYTSPSPRDRTRSRMPSSA